MPWFMYKDDLFIPADIRALTIDEAVNSGLCIARMYLVVLIGTASTRVTMNLSSSFGATTSRLNLFTRISQMKQ